MIEEQKNTKKPYITKADRIYNGDVLVFWKPGAWKIKTADVLYSDSRNGNYESAGTTDKQSLRIRGSIKAAYVKVIFTSTDGEYYITEPETIDRNGGNDETGE